MNTQDILNLVLIITLLVITTCIVFVTLFFIKALKAIEDTTQSIKDKIQMKALAALPALVIGLLGRVIKRKRG